MRGNLTRMKNDRALAKDINYVCQVENLSENIIAMTPAKGPTRYGLDSVSPIPVQPYKNMPETPMRPMESMLAPSNQIQNDNPLSLQQIPVDIFVKETILNLSSSGL